MNAIKNHNFQVCKTARFATIGPSVEDAKHVMIALHGYGQLPAFFLRKFEPLASEGWCIIAPEGFHRFYLEGTHGRVGASWMTKEDRETDIHDYLLYLDALSEHLNLRNRKPVLLGFSQGVATASRWVAAGAQTFQQLILWAGVFPPDFEWKTGKGQLNQMRLDVALGNDDPFFKDNLLTETASILDSMRVEYMLHRFEGGHAIDSDLLRHIVTPR
jgi:predicted esterase